MADADPDWWVGLGDEYEEERPLAQASLSASRTLNRAAAELRELRISEQTAGAGQKPASELHHSVSSSSVACSSLLNNSLRDGSAANHQRAHALGTHAPVTSPGFPPRKRQCPAVASPADLSCAALSQSQSMPSAVCDEKGPSSRLLRQIEWLLASRTDNADDTDARFSAAIEGIVEEATKRVSTAEKAAADAQNESSRLALLLQAAPSPEALGVQVANAREARAAQREAEAKLRLCMKKLQAVEREALDQGVVLSKATPSGRPAPQDAANRKASDTALRRYHRAGCSSRTYPVAPGSIQGQGQQGADLSTSCASSHKAAMPEIDEHTRALVRFYHDVASVVGSRSANLPPNPDRIKEVLDIVRNVEAASKRFKDLEEALSRCQSALSSRDMASVRVDTPQVLPLDALLFANLRRSLLCTALRIFLRT